jgi:hypothetical protein
MATTTCCSLSPGTRASARLVRAALVAAALAPTLAHAQSGWTLDKSANPATFGAAGEVIVYTYVITSSASDAELVSLTDDKLGTPSCPATSIPKGTSLACTATYVTTAADVAAGSVTNTATAVGDVCGDGCFRTATDSATITHVAPAASPAWTLRKSASPTTFSVAGQVVAYAYDLRNTGDVVISAIRVSDDRIAVVVCPQSTLVVGEDMTCTGNYVTTAADVARGSVTNTATAAGTPASGTLPAVSDQATIRLASAPSWELAKTADPSTFSTAGQVVRYRYALSNTGGMEIRRITLRDDRVTTVSCPATALAPGETMTCTGSDVTTPADVTRGSLTNTATATGTLAVGSLPPAVAQASIPYRAPAATSITIVAQARGGDETFGFASSVAGAESFALTTQDGGARRTFPDLPAGSYRFTEAELPPAWALSTLACTGDGGGVATVVDLASRTATVGLDGGEEITCTFVHVLEEGAYLSGVAAGIRGFLGRRQQLLTVFEPDRSRFLRRLPGSAWSRPVAGGPVTVDGHGGPSGSRLAIATSLSQLAPGDPSGAAGDGRGLDLWVETQFARFETTSQGRTTRDGDFRVVYVGGDKLLTPSLLIGVLAQFDRTSRAASAAMPAAEGDGFMVGPYASARAGRNLFFDGRVAWGRSDDSVEAPSRNADSFTTGRFLARANLSGNWSRSRFRVTPDLGLTWLRDTQRAYVDSRGARVPEQVVSLGRLTFGPEIAARISGRGGASYEPHVTLRGAWDFERPALQAGVDPDSFRASAQAGLLARLSNGWLFRVVGTVDGLADAGSRSWGGAAWINVPLSPR